MIVTNEAGRQPPLVSALLLVVALAACAIVGRTAHAQEQIRVGGNGSALAAVQLLAEAYGRAQGRVKVVMVPNLGSTGGIKAVSSGAIEIGLSGRALNDREIAAGARALEYGRTPFVFVTSSKTPAASDLTLAQVRDIYAGAIPTWPDGTRMRLVLRPESDSDTELLMAISPQMRETVRQTYKRPGMLVGITDEEAADLLEKLPGSFGGTTLALISSRQRALKKLRVDGIEPSVRNLAEGAYRHYKPQFFVTGPKTPPAADDFIAFVRSEAGRAILRETGHFVN